MLSCRVVDAWPAPSLSRLPTATPGPAEPHGELDARGAWISLTSKWVPGEPGSDRCTSAVTVPPAARITDVAAPRLTPPTHCSGLKSHARATPLSGATVPPLVLAGTAAATAGFNADATARTAGNVRRARAETVNDICLIILDR